MDNGTKIQGKERILILVDNRVKYATLQKWKPVTRKTNLHLLLKIIFF